MTITDLSDSTDLILADAAGDPLTATIQNSSITSNPSFSVPLPSSLLLLLIELLTLMGYGLLYEGIQTSNLP